MFSYIMYWGTLNKYARQLLFHFLIAASSLARTMSYSFAFALFFLLLCLVHAELTVKYDQNTKLTDEATLSWSFDSEQKMFSFGLELLTANVSTSGSVWVGIGVGEETSGSMLGADIVTAQFNNDVLDSCNTTNRHVPFVAFPLNEGPDTVFPAADTCQSDRSWKLISCSRDPTKKSITLEVRRPMEATTDQDRAISAGPMPMMYAYGVAGSVAYHQANRHSKRVVLVKEDGSYPETDKFVLPSDVTSNFTVQAGNYLVPEVRTTYACTAKKMQITAGEKLYVVAATNIIEPRAHHFLVWGCEDNAFTRNYSTTQDCFSNNRSGTTDPRAKCTALFHVWAVGRGPLVLPKDIGFLVEESYSMIMMETHYDNPAGSNNTRDSSGVTLHFSKNRTVEAGTLQVGDGLISFRGETVKNDFNYTSTCPSSCTSTWKEDKINVFGTFSHMHTTGKTMWTNRYDSEGNFVQTMTSVAFWSNDHQAGIDYVKPLEVRKGDILSTTCNFDTTKVPETKWGFETQDEMCIDFLWYYPVQKRNETDGTNFYCGMAYEEFNGTEFNGTICGAVTPGAFNATQVNPSFVDTVGFSSSFGNQPVTCPAALAVSTNDTANTNESVCFPASAQVNTRDRGVVTMAELNLDDEVEVGGGKYSQVYMFTHREPSKTYMFVQLETNVGTRLRLTAGHFIYANGVLKRADEVNVGDHLLDRYNKPMVVMNVGVVLDEGLFNPQTLHGDIVVDGVIASTYTHTIEKFAAHAMLAPLRAIHEWIGVKCVAFEKDDYFVIRMFNHLRNWGINRVFLPSY